MLKHIFLSHPKSELTIRYAEDRHLVVGMQLIIDQLKFDRNLYQYFIRFRSPWPRLEKTQLDVSWWLVTASNPLHCDQFIMFFDELLQSLTYKVNISPQI